MAALLSLRWLVSLVLMLLLSVSAYLALVFDLSISSQLGSLWQARGPPLHPSQYFASLASDSRSPSFSAYCPSDPSLLSSPTHVAVANVCPRPAHSGSNYTSAMVNDWLSIPVPLSSSQAAFEQRPPEPGPTRLLVWDADIDLVAGEMKLPLVEEVLSQGGAYRYQFPNGALLSFIHDSVKRDLAFCNASYADGSRLSSLGRIWHQDPNNKMSPVFLICALQAFKTPTSILVQLAPQSSVELAVCSRVLQRFYAVIQLKAYFSWALEELVDWLEYHYFIGFDHVELRVRHPLTVTEKKVVAPYIDSGLLSLQHWPQRIGPKGGVDVYADQDMLLMVSQFTTRKQAVWVLAPDMDEFLYLNAWDSRPPYRRSCNNSLHCPSPMRDFLDTHRQDGIITYWTRSFVPFVPPPEQQREQDRFRYAPENSFLPFPVRRVHWRPNTDSTTVLICKWIFQPNYALHFMTHGGSTVRYKYNDQQLAVIHTKHYHRYEHSNVSRFWSQHEGQRDTGVADILQARQWPVGTDERLLAAAERWWNGDRRLRAGAGRAQTRAGRRR